MTLPIPDLICVFTPDFSALIFHLLNFAQGSRPFPWQAFLQAQESGLTNLDWLGRKGHKRMLACSTYSCYLWNSRILYLSLLARRCLPWLHIPKPFGPLYLVLKANKPSLIRSHLMPVARSFKYSTTFLNICCFVESSIAGSARVLEISFWSFTG